MMKRVKVCIQAVFLAAAAWMLAGCEQKTDADRINTETATMEEIRQEHTETVGDTETMSNTEAMSDTEEAIDLSGMDPYAAAEIQSILDKMNAAITTANQADDAVVIQQAATVMGLAVGNSLVQDQVTLVIKAWKQGKTDTELAEFQMKYALVYDAYLKLAGTEAEEQLEKAGLSLADYDYCGKGSLDMVEWIKTCIE